MSRALGGAMRWRGEWVFKAFLGGSAMVGCSSRSSGDGGAPVSIPAKPDPKPEVASVPVQEGLVGGGRKFRDEGEEWVPAEFKKGASRWKDTGVYLDGQPLGVLSFGELPVRLKPVWVEESISAEKRIGD